MRKKIERKNPLIIKSKRKWSYPNRNHPTDKLQIKLLLNEKIKGKRIVGLEAKINPGDVHQLHRHNNEYVIVYSTNEKCKVTMENKTRIVHPGTLIFIPPKV